MSITNAVSGVHVIDSWYTFNKYCAINGDGNYLD